ncbi:cation:proton antiporter [Chloroflexota bacterium]
MEAIGLVAVLICVLLAAAVSKRVQNTIITLPMIYTLFGLAFGLRFLGLVNITIESQIIHIIAELTLILVLSTDASRIDLRALFRDHAIPLRLLSIGLPLMMVFGGLLAYFMFGEPLGIWGAVILAIVLAPTDASLGQSVVSNPRVPVRIRQALNIESGLNDGIAMPFLLLAIALAVSTERSQNVATFLRLTGAEIIFGILAGVLVGYLGMKFIQLGGRSGWMSDQFQKISSLALALLAYGFAEMIGGNGYIAAFCYGLASSNTTSKEESEPIYEYAEMEVTILMLLTFIIFGMVMLPPALEAMNPQVALYALLSLVLVRTLSVAISMIRVKTTTITTLFLGWFGPRGVASILYVLTVLEAEDLAGQDLIFTVAMVTIFFSVLVHGVTAAPLSNWYGRRMETIEEVQPDVLEAGQVTEMPLREEVGKGSQRI